MKNQTKKKTNQGAQPSNILVIGLLTIASILLKIGFDKTLEIFSVSQPTKATFVTALVCLVAGICIYFVALKKSLKW
jgi:hypothetical protein